MQRVFIVCLPCRTGFANRVNQAGSFPPRLYNSRSPASGTVVESESSRHISVHSGPINSRLRAVVVQPLGGGRVLNNFAERSHQGGWDLGEPDDCCNGRVQIDRCGPALSVRPDLACYTRFVLHTSRQHNGQQHLIDFMRYIDAILALWSGSTEGQRNQRARWFPLQWFTKLHSASAPAPLAKLLSDDDEVM